MDRLSTMIVILTMNRPYFIKQCLDSLFKYNDVNLFDLKVINSIDKNYETHKIIKSYVRKYQYKIEYKAINNWLAPSLIRRNEFLESHNRGYKYVMTIDDDCLLFDNAVEKAINKMEKCDYIHALSGYVIENGLKRMLGGYIHIEGKNMHFQNIDDVTFQCVDYLSGGLTIYRLNPLLLHDNNYKIGYIDWDLSLQINKTGLLMVISNDIGAYHQMVLKNNKLVFRNNSREYMKIRKNKEYIEESKKLFYKKWGYYPISDRDNKLSIKLERIKRKIMGMF